MLLVEIAPPAFDLVIDLRYATADNFTGAPVYRPGAARAYLHPEAAAALARAMAPAARLGYRLRLFDDYRPPEAQWALWRHTPDPAFLADPRRGSPHSRGAAVDLTLIDGGSGRDLEMGTGFDAFTPLSHHGSPGVSPAAARNRLLLLGLMTDAGWDFYRNEWWHYQLHDARRRFPLIADGAGGERLM